MRRLLQSAILLFFISPLSGQTVHIGGNFSYFGSYLFNKSVKFAGNDTVYVLSDGIGAGLSGAFYFDYGGYYYRKIYGIKTEVNISRHNQTYKVFAGPGAANPNIYYKYIARLHYLDIPVMFNFCPTHHQGFTVECGPQISFLQSAEFRNGKSTVTPPSLPELKKSELKKTSWSAVLGAGCFYSFSERFAMIGTFRVGYSFTDLTREIEGITPYYPTNRFYAGAFIQAVYKINKYGSSKNRGYKYYLKRLKKK